jgi:hypothetical protein
MGKVVRAQGPNVFIRTNNGISVIASLDPQARMRFRGLGQPRVEVTGKLRPEDVQKGMCVRFAATVAGQTRRTVADPLKEVNVFTPDQTTQFGLLSEGVGVGEPEAVKPGEPQTCVVVGSISSVRSGTITVEFGGAAKGTVKAKIADDAIINYKGNTLYAPPGADVSVEGMQPEGAGEPVNLLVSNIQIRLPPPPPPKSKIARAPASDDQKNPFDGENAEGGPENAGEGGAAAEGTQKAKTPGKIIKVN